MIIALFNSREGFAFDAYKFVEGLRVAGQINLQQMQPLRSSLLGLDIENLHIEKIGGKLWVTVLTKRHVIWTWSVGQRGKTTSPNLDTSESSLGPIEALNCRA